MSLSAGGNIRAKEEMVTTATATKPKRRIAWGRYLLFFFVAAWMFALGVLVGRGTAPLHFDTQALQQELADLRDAMLQKERIAVEKALRGEDRKAPLEFYEALKKDEPDTAVQIRAAEAPANPTPGREKAPETLQPPHKPRSAIMAKQAAVKGRPKGQKRPLATPSAVATTGNLTIQVASLKDATAAGKMVADLEKKGYSARLSRIVIPDNGLWFRVQVGSYQTREQAAADIERLTRERKKVILVTK